MGKEMADFELCYGFSNKSDINSRLSINATAEIGYIRHWPNKFIK